MRVRHFAHTLLTISGFVLDKKLQRNVSKFGIPKNYIFGFSVFLFQKYGKLLKHFLGTFR